ncbi:metallophosphoesterase family protein [Nitriliruptoraceae bacterium ZYF776]|nr:metallophosphoesterase family protein [Profundirhabdus halotolerans]
MHRETGRYAYVAVQGAAPVSDVPPTGLSRRELLRHGGRTALLGAAGLGLLGAAPARLVPDGRAPARMRVPVGGPFGDAYGAFGEPRGVGLTQTGAFDSTRTVTWLTSGRRDPGTRLRYGVVPPGTSAGAVASGRTLDHEVRGRSVLAPHGRFDRDLGASRGPEAGEVEVRTHRADVTGLRPGQRIAYQVGGDGGWSPVRTWTVPGARDEFRFTHVGDHGTTVAARRTTRAVQALRPDLHLLAGDLSYANGDQRVWDRWQQQLAPLAGQVPILYAPGNHEAQDFFGETYRRRFARPDPSVAWYGFDVGNLHVTSTTAGALIAGNEARAIPELLFEELRFLERDLADAARRRADGELDFLVVVQHYPLFTEHRTRGPFSPELVLLEEQLLQRYAVDLVLVGHDHMYQRSHPMVAGQPAGRADGGDGPGLGYVQVLAGAGGQSLYEFTPIDLATPRFDPANPVQRRGRWSAAWAREFSFVAYDVQGPSIEATAYGWYDVEGQNVVPDVDRYDEELVRVDPDAVDPDLAPRVIDRFTVRRKPQAVLDAAALLPRLVGPLLGRLPEFRGRVVPNLAEDCTRH